MKQLIFCVALVMFFVAAVSVWACDCDTAAAMTWGMKDRLHQPWPNDPELQKQKSAVPDNQPKTEVQTGNEQDRSVGRSANTSSGR